MTEHYNKQGELVSTDEWIKLFEDPSYQRVAHDKAKGDIVVSTVWLGLDHGFGGGPPLIFETMAFGDYEEDEICQRYSTLEEALQGHAQIVQRFGGSTQNLMPEPPPEPEHPPESPIIEI